MDFQFSFYTLPLVTAALFSILVAVYVWPRRHTPGATALALIALAIAEWGLGYALEIAGANLATKVFWGKSQYLGIVSAPYFWLLFALTYTRQGKQWNPRWMNWLTLLPITTLILLFTTEQHGLVWAEMSVREAGGFSVLGVIYGPWFWVHFAYSYIFMFVGTAVMLNTLRHMQGLYRAQIVALLLGILSPWVGNVIYFSGLSPIPELDITPFAFTITVTMLTWGIYGYRLGDIAPIARDLVIEGMRDGMIVLDRRNRVADLNTAAAHMIGVPAAEAIGKMFADLLSPWPHLSEQFQNVVEASGEIFIGEGEAKRRYEVRISSLFDQQKHPIGRVITIQDINETPTPPLRFAVRETPQPMLAGIETSHKLDSIVSNPILKRLKDFLIIPPKTDIEVPFGVNPFWNQTIERGFTFILRTSAFLGSIALIFTFPYLGGFSNPVNFIFSVIVILLWLLGLLRSIPFHFRTTLLLCLVYVLAFVETATYGYSVESFTFFLTFMVLAALLAEAKGGLIALFVGLVTMSIFGWQIGQGNFIPIGLRNDPPVLPTIQAATSSMLVFAASGSSLVTAVILLMHSLNKAWQMENQALNLFQQERDLLEQRVTERTRALAEARDQAIKSNHELQKYFLAIQQSGNTIFITNAEGTIEYVNPKFEEQTGYSFQEAVGHTPRLLKSGEQKSQFYANLWQTIRSGQIWHGEFQNQHKNGSLFWESATIAPVVNLEGEITHYVAIQEDITAQRELQEKLKQQNQYLSILHQTTLNLLNRQNLKELLQAVVERACLLLDAPMGEIMLKEDEYMVVRAYTKEHTFLAEERTDRQTAKLSWKAHDTGKPVVLEDYIAWPEHRPIFDDNPLYAVAVIPVMVGEACIGVLSLGRTQPRYPFNTEQIETGVSFAQLVALVIDNANLYDSALKEIEDRKRAEVSLQRINQEQKTLTSLLQISMEPAPLNDLLPAMLQEILSISWLDPATQAGIFLAEEPTKPLVLKAHYNLNKHQQTFANGVEDEQHYSIPILSRQILLGMIVLYLPTDCPKTEKDKSFLQVVANTLAGIIERKRAEAQLAVARDQALEASNFKSQLLAKVSHELRTPLGAILGYSELLQDEAFGPLSARQKQITGEVIESTHYLTALVSELLDAARFEASKTQLHVDAFAPGVLLQQVETKMSVLAQRKKLTFATHLSPELPTVLYGDERRLQQLLVNLIGNAIKFTKKGEVKVSFFLANAAQWGIQVADTGPGIPKEAQTYIFEPFRQVDGSMTREHRGTGLGLSIVKQLLSLMKGEIALESEVGKGSIFTVLLPVLAPQEAVLEGK